jgi:hypothetical protein
VAFQVFGCEAANVSAVGEALFAAAGSLPAAASKKCRLGVLPSVCESEGRIRPELQPLKPAVKPIAEHPCFLAAERDTKPEAGERLIPEFRWLPSGGAIEST